MNRRQFLPVNIALLTVSDTRTAATTAPATRWRSWPRRPGTASRRGASCDEIEAITGQLRAWIADPEIDVVIATGGTGVTGRDVTPEAFYSVYEKEIAGFGELFRWLSYAKIGTSTIQSRATAGVAGGTYLFALPGSPSACRDAWEDILVAPARQPLPALQFRRADAAPAGASAAPEGEGRVGLSSTSIGARPTGMGQGSPPLRPPRRRSLSSGLAVRGPVGLTPPYDLAG